MTNDVFRKVLKMVCIKHYQQHLIVSGVMMESVDNESVDSAFGSSSSLCVCIFVLFSLHNLNLSWFFLCVCVLILLADFASLVWLTINLHYLITERRRCSTASVYITCCSWYCSGPCMDYQCHVCYIPLLLLLLTLVIQKKSLPLLFSSVVAVKLPVFFLLIMSPFHSLQVLEGNRPVQWFGCFGVCYSWSYP